MWAWWRASWSFGPQTLQHHYNSQMWPSCNHVFYSLDFSSPNSISPFAIPCTSRNWPKCNHSICNYIRLLVISNYIWTCLQLFFSCSSKNKNLCPISYKCDQFSSNPMNIQRCILWILRNIVGCIKIYKCIFWMYMNNHIRFIFKYDY